MIREITACRSCGGTALTPVLDLGNLHINAFPLPQEPDSPKAPLSLVLCPECHLVQLKHTVDADVLYKRFWYKSGVTKTMSAALTDVVEGVRERIALAPGDTVIDIGSNDSTLLANYNASLERVGFEPAENLMDAARANAPGAVIVNDYFSLRGLREVTGKQAKVISCVACFYDLDDPNRFVHDIAEALAPDGLFVIQMAYLPSMLRTNDIGNVCHEHLEYYSLHSLQPLLTAHGLNIFDAEENDVNGGSIRVYACKLGSRVRQFQFPTNRFIDIFQKERFLGLHTEHPYRLFAKTAEKIKEFLHLTLREEPGPRWVYGASTKGNTMLQWWGLGPPLLEGAAERDPAKYGRLTVGTRIPIFAEDYGRSIARTFLVLPFHFREEIERREYDWLLKGGRMVFPLPRVEVIGGRP